MFCNLVVSNSNYQRTIYLYVKGSRAKHLFFTNLITKSKINGALFIFFIDDNYYSINYKL